jgi:hypothetical protein
MLQLDKTAEGTTQLTGRIGLNFALAGEFRRLARIDGALG